MTINFSSNNPYKNFIQIAKCEKMQPASQPELLAQPAYPQPQLASVTVGEINGDVEKKNNTSHKKIFGIIGVSVGSVALLTLIGLFTLSKGFSASFAKKVKHASKTLQKKIYELSADTKELTTSQKMKLRISKAMQPIADAMQASSNITSIKDSWINHWLKKMKLEPVIKKMNNVFKEIISKNTRNYYIKAETSNLKFCAYLDELAVEAQKAGKPELKAQLENYARELRALYKNTFTSAEHFERTNNAFASMEGLDKQVYDKLFADNGLFKNLKKYKTYITTDLIEKDRTKLAENLLTRKAGLSNNINDNYNNIRRLLNDIKINVNPKDEKAVELVKNLSNSLEEYKNAAGTTETAVREKLYKTFKSDMNKLSEIFESDKQYADNISEVKNKIAEFYSAINPSVAKKGKAQEAITLIKENFGKNTKEYQKAKELMSDLNTDLNKAISSELNTYEKLAELQVGSLPADILGILGPTALGAMMVVGAENKDERISKTLTQGIPIVGGVATSYYGNTRGWTGAKNLFLGFAIGYVLNILGTQADGFYKKYIEKQNLLKTTFESWNKLQSKNVHQDKTVTNA